MIQYSQYLQFASCAGEAEEPLTNPQRASLPDFPPYVNEKDMQQLRASYIVFEKKNWFGIPQGTSIGLLLSAGVEVAVIGAAQGWASALEHFLVSSQACLGPRRRELTPPGGLWIAGQALNGLVLRHHIVRTQYKSSQLPYIPSFLQPCIHHASACARLCTYTHTCCAGCNN